jgi:hypothetical protein
VVVVAAPENANRATSLVRLRTQALRWTPLTAFEFLDDMFLLELDDGAWHVPDGVGWACVPSG